MNLSDFDFKLPEGRIAVFPPEDRASARLLRVDKQSGTISHHVFRDLPQFLQAGDLLVLNDTKVIPARIFGQKETGGRVEALLLEDLGEGKWEALLRSGGRIKKNSMLAFGENGLRVEAEVLDDARPDSGERLLDFNVGADLRPPTGEAGVGPHTGGHMGPSLRQIFKKIGHIPLPPYIDRPDSPIDRKMYQTVFAEKEGAVASPTAGLHFDEKLLDKIRAKGIEIAFVTLHVSYGTFQPIAVENLAEHKMFEERFEITAETAGQINRALSEKRRIIACGTTVVRVLESACRGAVPAPGTQGGGTLPLQPMKGRTRLFIYPPYEFKIVQGLITNFHLPKSSLLLLVSAFLGRQKLLNAYDEAIREGYRFYSYGDAMVIL